MAKKCGLCGREFGMLDDFYYHPKLKKKLKIMLCESCYDLVEEKKLFDEKLIEEEKIKKEKEAEFGYNKLLLKKDFICAYCSTKVGVGRKKIILMDKYEKAIPLCFNCYEKIPKNEKISLDVLLGETKGLNPGWALGAMGAAGYEHSIKSTVDGIHKKFDLSFEEINEFSIMNFNIHFKLCDNQLKYNIMSQMGKELEKKNLMKFL